MRRFNTLLSAVAGLACAAALASPASAIENTVAERLSAALGGTLGKGMSGAGGLGHGKFDAAVELRTGRTDQFRQQVLASDPLYAKVVGRR